MNYQQAAQMSLDVQDACNLNGVVNSFANQVMPAIRAEADRQGLGTDFINQNPIVTLFIDKMASLNRTQFDCGKVFDAYEKVRGIAALADVPNPA